MRDRLLDREPRPDGRAHRRLDHRRAGDDADRPRVPEDARPRDRHHPRGRRRHRRLQHPVRRQPGGRSPDRHRDEPARLAVLARWPPRRPASRSPRSPRRSPSATPSTRSATTSRRRRRPPSSRRSTTSWSRCRASPSRSSPSADPTLTTHMKSVGEAMAIGRNFTEALQKALRSLESKHAPFDWHKHFDDELASATKAALLEEIKVPHRRPAQEGHGRHPGRRDAGGGLRGHQDRPVVRRPARPDQRGRRRSSSTATELDPRPAAPRQAPRLLRRADRQDPRPARRRRPRRPPRARASGRSSRPSTPAPPSSPRRRPTTTRPTTRRPRCEPRAEGKEAVIILGSGPNRIGQGIEFDYSCVHASHRAGRGRLRDDHGQLQPGDGQHRLRHLRPALLRAAHAGGRPRDRPRRAAGRPDRRRRLPARRPDAARPRAGPRRRRRADRRHHARRRSTSPRSAAPSAACSPTPGCRRPSTAWRRRTPRRSGSPTRSATRCWCGRPTSWAGAAWRSSTTTPRWRPTSRSTSPTG